MRIWRCRGITVDYGTDKAPLLYSIFSLLSLVCVYVARKLLFSETIFIPFYFQRNWLFNRVSDNFSTNLALTPWLFFQTRRKPWEICWHVSYFLPVDKFPTPSSESPFPSKDSRRLWFFQLKVFHCTTLYPARMQLFALNSPTEHLGTEEKSVAQQISQFALSTDGSCCVRVYPAEPSKRS